MPQVSLRLKPSVNAEFTETLNEAGITSCNRIRFKAGLPQKLGGWEKFYQFQLAAVARDLHAWQDLNSDDWLAYASTTEVDVITNDEATDVTPQVLESDFTPDFDTTSGDATVDIDDPNITDVTAYDSILFMTPISVGGLVLKGVYPISVVTAATIYQIEAASNATANVTAGGAVPEFDTTSGSAFVLVTFANHGQAVGDRFTFLLPTTVGGVTISGTYVILTVPTADTFTIAADQQASSTTSAFMNGGDVQLIYYINIGPPAGGAGYGTGGYGEGGYGTGVTGGAQTGDPLEATDYSLDNWGEILLANPRGGGIYQWQPNSGFQNLGLISQAPIFNNGIFVAMPAQILVAWGSTASVGGTQQDPLIVRWCDQEDYTIWTPQSSNQAGSFRIPTGSEIMGGLQGPQQALIWTDIEAWAMVYQGAPYVFGFNKLSSGCGLIGPHAAAVMRGNVFWMNPGNFFMLGGNGVQVIPCSVWDVVFQDLDTANQRKCIAAPNSTFDEISFFYPSVSGETGECDKYVKYNLAEQTWDYGSMSRSAWIDQSVLGQPIGCNSSGIIYQHETSPDADGQAMNSWFETGYFTMSDAQDMIFVDWMFPDFKWGEFGGSDDATILCTITAVDYPNATERVFGPFTLTNAKRFINLRLRGRQIKLKFESNDLGSFWRLGLTRVRAARDGRR